MLLFLEKTIKKLAKKADLLLILFLFFYVILMFFLTRYRDIANDEGMYFRESWLIYELLKEGAWIGNYAVGVHGFLFKIPPALIFFLTGPSIDVVTWFNILLGLLTSFLFYKLIKDVLKNSWYALLGTVFLMTSFHFVLSMPTFLREIPSLFVIILFLYSIVKRWNIFYVSLIMLLLLDVKEYVFLVYAVFYVIWLFVDYKGGGLVNRIWYVIKTSFIVFLPSLIWIILMFTTGLIPLNTFLASILGLVQGDFTYTVKHFTPEFTSTNLIDGGREISLITGTNGVPLIIVKIIEIYNVIVSYIGNILYPRSFSFLSVPKEVILPVVISAVLYIRKKVGIKNGSKRATLLLSSSILILVWLLFYILRTTHGRYLLPILPSISITFIGFLFFTEFSKKQKIFILVATVVYSLLGLFFESSYITQKGFIYIFLLILLGGIFSAKSKWLFGNLYIIVVSLIALGTALLFSYTKGQINSYLAWGENKGVEEIVKIFPEEKRFAVNNFGNTELISVLVDDKSASPEWNRTLKPEIPKKALLKTLPEGNYYEYTIYFNESTERYFMQGFIDFIEQEEIEVVYLVVSEIEGEELTGEGYYEEFEKLDWLKQREEYFLENKIVYVFDVIR